MNDPVCAKQRRIQKERAVPAEVAYTSACYATKPEHSGLCDPALSGMVGTAHGNFAGLYPPVFYSTMSVFSSADVQTSILLMRGFNSLLAVTLFTSIYLLVDRRLRAPMLWGLLLAVVPTGAFLIASVNPSGWAIMSAATLWVALVGYFRAPTAGRRTALGGLALVAALMGAGSRGDSAVYVAFGAVIAAIISFERTRRYLYLLSLPVVTAIMAAVFYLSSNQVGAALGGEMSPNRPEHIDLVGGLLRTMINIPQLWVGNFGIQALGWGDVQLPAAVWFSTLVLYCAIAFWALARRHDARTYVAIVLAGIALIMVPSWVIVQNGAEVGALVQPRYVLPLQILLIGLLLFGAGDPRRALSPVQRWVFFLGLAGANAVSLHTIMRRYLTGTDHYGLDLNEDVVWWWHDLPVPPGVVWFVGAVAFGAVAFIVSGARIRRERVVLSESPVASSPEQTSRRQSVEDDGGI